MDPHLAELAHTIDPVELGRRIRNARLAAGMTQAQVVAGDVSAAYLSRIEDGQRRPEVGLLDRMARRMGTTLEELLLGPSGEKARALRLLIDHAELSLAGGEPQAALDRVDHVLSEVGDDDMPDVRRAALQVRAGALEAIGDLNGAIVILEDLAASPRPDASWLRCLIALSRCYRDMGDFARAITAGERAAGIIEELGIQGLTEAIQLTVTVAAAYHDSGDVEEAKRMCLRALQEADKYDSPVAKASAYWNSSLLEAEAHGPSDAAVDMAKKALAIFELAEDNRNLAKLRAEVANLQLSQDDPEAALKTLELSVRELAGSGGSAYDLAHVHLTRARAQLVLGDPDAALRSIEQGLELAPDPAPQIEATAASLRGQIAAAAGRLDDAREQYRKAIYALTAIGSDRKVAQLWFELANLLAEIGDHEGAVQAFRSAGASSGLRLTREPVQRTRP